MSGFGPGPSLYTAFRATGFHAGEDRKMRKGRLLGIAGIAGSSISQYAELHGIQAAAYR
jgi:hypothetical protein